MPIPNAFEPSWKFIWNEVVDVHAKWKIHEQLFAKGQKLLDLLMDTSSNFFAIVQEVLLLSVQLTISKLSDRPRMGEFENLNLAKLAEEAYASDSGENAVEKAASRGRLTGRLAVFAEGSRKVRERRNKYLAHLDYDVALNTSTTPLLSVSRHEIENALEALRDYMRELEDHFQESPTVYANPILTWDGDLLVESLKRAKRYVELEGSEIVDYEDWRKSSWADA